MPSLQTHQKTSSVQKQLSGNMLWITYVKFSPLNIDNTAYNQDKLQQTKGLCL